MIATLSNEQKDWLRKSGFGHLLEFSLTGLPHKLGYKILQAFDHASVSLRLKSGQIFITERDVSDVLGLPVGPRKIITTLNDERRALWRGQFKGVEGYRITAMAICQMIKKSATVDDLFKLNFLVVMSNTLVHSQGNPYVDQSMVNFVGDLDKTAEYNWGALVIESLVESKQRWAEDPRKKFYQGPLAFIILLYVDRVLYKGKRTVEKRIPSFLGWTFNDLRQRQNEELGSKSFGMGALATIHPSMIPEKVDTSAKKQVDVDSESDNENIEVDCLKQLEKNFSKYIQSKTMFESSLELAKKVIPSNTRLQDIIAMAERLTGGQASEHEPSMESPASRSKTGMQTEGADMGFTQILETDQEFRDRVIEAVNIEEASALKKKKDGPSFSLKVTQEIENVQVEKGVEQGGVVPLVEKEITPDIRGKAKRVARPGLARRSPYIDRVSDINKKACEDEQQVWD